MSDITKRLGQRIKHLRIEQGLSQEQLGELAGLHYTYIGQLERGEKNPTITSIEKVTKALNIPLSSLFEKIDEAPKKGTKNYPLEAYNLISSKSNAEQQHLVSILQEISRYNSNDITTKNKER